MKLHTRLLAVFAATVLSGAPLAMAEMNRTEATIVGAAVGGVIGHVAGSDTQSTLIGAAAGGLLGNLLSQSNSNYTREGRYNSRYYYGGREFRNQREYNAYRDVVRRHALIGQERNRYQNYVGWQRQQMRSHAFKSRGKSIRAQQKWRNGRRYGKYRR